MARALNLFPSIDALRIPWPSEGGLSPQSQQDNKFNAIWFSHPPSPSDWDFAYAQISFWKPLIITFDLHPKHILSQTQKENSAGQFIPLGIGNSIAQPLVPPNLE